MRAGVTLVLAAGLLAGCGLSDRLGIGLGTGLGQTRVRSGAAVPYRATLTASREDKRDFVVVTREVAVPLDELRDSLRYPATRYCIQTFGASDIAWTANAAGDDWAVVSDGQTLSVSGRCTAR